MGNIKLYIESGILESYVLKHTNEKESKEVEAMMCKHPEIRMEIYEISKNLELYAVALSLTPKPQVKNLLLIKIQNLEKASKPKFVFKSSLKITAKKIKRIFNPVEILFLSKEFAYK